MTIFSFRNVWPESKTLLCIWHVQQAVWRYIWARDHNVLKSHRKHLFKLFRSVVYARSRESYDRAVDKMMSDELAGQYHQYLHHIENSYLHRPEMFAMYSRIEQGLPTNGITTNNFLENSFRILKENVFKRCKAYNLLALIKILLEDSSASYRQKMVDIGNSLFQTLAKP